MYRTRLGQNLKYSIHDSYLNSLNSLKYLLKHPYPTLKSYKTDKTLLCIKLEML